MDGVLQLYLTSNSGLEHKSMGGVKGWVSLVWRAAYTQERSLPDKIGHRTVDAKLAKAAAALKPVAACHSPPPVPLTSSKAASIES